jgi:non-ribosomal peptide synthetase component F
MPIDGKRNLEAGWHSELRPHAEREVRLSIDAQAALRAVARRAGCTYFTCIVGVVHLWQWLLTGKDDLVLMATVDTRDGATADLVGSFINDTVLRTRMPPSATSSFANLLDRTRSTVEHALDKVDVAPLAAWDAIFSDAVPLPYVILLDWIPSGAGHLALIDIEVTDLADEGTFLGIAESEFEMEFDEEGGVMSFCYDTTLYSKSTIDRMLDIFHEAVTVASNHSTDRLPEPRAVYRGRLESTIPSTAECERCVRVWQQGIADGFAKL